MTQTLAVRVKRVGAVVTRVVFTDNVLVAVAHDAPAFVVETWPAAAASDERSAMALAAVAR